MKSKFLLLLALLIVTPISYSIDKFTIDQKTNPTLIIDFNEYTVTQLIKTIYNNLKSKQLSEDQLSKVKSALPVSLKLNITDTNETIFLEFTKKGEILMPDSIVKADFEIITTREKFLSIIQSDKTNLADMKSLIENNYITVKTYSLKAEIYVQVIEDKLNFKIVKHKTFRARTIGFIAGKMAGLFIPNQQ